MITREEALRQLEMFSMTREEAGRFLDAPQEERRKIVQGVQKRIRGELMPPMFKESVMPMSPEEGPPLPRRWEIRWPWKR